MLLLIHRSNGVGIGVRLQYRLHDYSDSHCVISLHAVDGLSDPFLAGFDRMEVLGGLVKPTRCMTLSVKTDTRQNDLGKEWCVAKNLGCVTQF